MSDDDKSMGVQLICNQRVGTYNNLQGTNPMYISSPWANYKTNNYSQIQKCKKQPYYVTQKVAKD